MNEKNVRKPDVLERLVKVQGEVLLSLMLFSGVFPLSPKGACRTRHPDSHVTPCPPP